MAGLYVFKVPGAGFGLGALAIIAYFALHAPETLAVLFERNDDPESIAVHQSPNRLGSMGSASTVWPIVFGALIGLVLSAALVSALVMPPAYLGKWVSSPEPIGARIERALNPGEQWVALAAKEREVSEALKRFTAELKDTQKRLVESESALTKAQDELGLRTSNTIRGIKIAEKSGSRHADGAVYIGVEQSLPSGSSCTVRVSSDKVDGVKKYLHVGEAIPIASARGKFRVVLVALDSRACVFDLVKD